MKVYLVFVFQMYRCITLQRPYYNTHTHTEPLNFNCIIAPTLSIRNTELGTDLLTNQQVHKRKSHTTETTGVFGFLTTVRKPHTLHNINVGK